MPPLLLRNPPFYELYVYMGSNLLVFSVTSPWAFVLKRRCLSLRVIPIWPIKCHYLSMDCQSQAAGILQLTRCLTGCANVLLEKVNITFINESALGTQSSSARSAPLVCLSLGYPHVYLGTESFSVERTGASILRDLGSQTFTGVWAFSWILL